MIEVPEIPVDEKVELPANKTVLIVVDMQNDFVKQGGKLVVATAGSTISSIKKLLDKARDVSVRIVYTMDTHKKDDPEYKIWGEHVQEGTWGWQIVDELKPHPDDLIVRKTRYDAFYGTPLDEYLRLWGIENVVITGTVANICVLHTAGSAALRFYKVIVPLDAISALNEFDMKAALRQVSFLYRGIITTSDGIQFVK